MECFNCGHESPNGDDCPTCGVKLADQRIERDLMHNHV